jgi:phosphoglycolate phosphatase-like HAD superfamily hydrolase
MQTFVLWDIDGTLIHGGGVAGEAFRAAMTRFFGPFSPELDISYAGKTDQQIVLETYAEREQAALLTNFESFTTIYSEELHNRYNQFQARGSVLDGVHAILSRLANDPRVVQSVLTGNIKLAAQIKLDVFGLASYLDLECGAYGSDHHDRSELVPVAAKRAEKRHQRRFAGSEIVVIGDTPNDIACAKAGGARSIGVATGHFRADELHAAGADLVLPNLSATHEVWSAIVQ